MSITLSEETLKEINRWKAFFNEDEKTERVNLLRFCNRANDIFDIILKGVV